MLRCTTGFDNSWDTAEIVFRALAYRDGDICPFDTNFSRVQIAHEELKWPPLGTSGIWWDSANRIKIRRMALGNAKAMFMMMMMLLL